MKSLILYCLLFMFMLPALPANSKDSISAKMTDLVISYRTPQASEVTMVWGINEWNTPPGKYLPPGSYLKDKLAYTLMQASGDSFRLALRVPENTQVDYVLWLSKDKHGQPFDWWDDNHKSTYHAIATTKKTRSFDTEIIQKFAKPSFNLLTYGIWALGFALGINLMLLAIRRPLFSKAFDRDYFNRLLGQAFSLFMLMLIIRIQLNKLHIKGFYLAAGSVYYDLITIVAIVIGMAALFKLSRSEKIRRAGFIFFTALFVFMALLSLINIEMVRTIGRPVTYAWFYYSDFLKSNEAQMALKENLKPKFILNLLMLLCAFVLMAFPLTLMLRQLITRRSLNKSALITGTLCLFLLLVGKWQISSGKLQLSKVQNPLLAFINSIYTSGQTTPLLTMKIPEPVAKRINGMHTPARVQAFNDKPKHIILFVLESTPAEYLGAYQSKFNVTPNLTAWSQHARIFDNLYAVTPSTPASLFTMAAGIYPMISYKSPTYEYPGADYVTLAALAQPAGRQCAAISSTSWHFSGMDSFLVKQGFYPVENYKDVRCEGLVFTSRWSMLDGVDDRCMAKAIAERLDGAKDSASIQIAWTMQTHYPYFYSGDEKKYTATNPDLNRYLNALQNIDEAFGILMDGLSTKKRLSETMVIVVGDHGEAFGRHDQITHASKIYEENLHIPCMIIWPGHFHGDRDNRIGSIIDIAPTILHAAGISIPTNWQGQSLLGSSSKEQAFFFSPYSNFLFGTRKDNWKLIYDAMDNSFELYDLAADPMESNNVSAQYPEKVEQGYLDIAAWVQYHNTFMNNLLKSVPTSNRSGEN